MNSIDLIQRPLQGPCILQYYNFLLNTFFRCFWRWRRQKEEVCCFPDHFFCAQGISKKSNHHDLGLKLHTLVMNDVAFAINCQTTKQIEYIYRILKYFTVFCYRLELMYCFKAPSFIIYILCIFCYILVTKRLIKILCCVSLNFFCVPFTINMSIIEYNVKVQLF